jgi:biotin transport system substrate-specific component
MYGDEQRSLLVSHTATFIALIAAGAWISIPLIPVPITLQTLFVLLSGVVMKRAAAIPAALYVLLGAMNLPVFHNGLAGIGILLGPTGGYLIGFIPAACIVGFAYEYSSKITRIAGICTGIAVLYVCGIIWLTVSTSIPLGEALFIGVVPFVIGEILKMSAAYTIGERIR